MTLFFSLLEVLGQEIALFVASYNDNGIRIIGIQKCLAGI